MSDRCAQGYAESPFRLRGFVAANPGFVAGIKKPRSEQVCQARGSMATLAALRTKNKPQSEDQGIPLSAALRFYPRSRSAWLWNKPA